MRIQVDNKEKNYQMKAIRTKLMDFQHYFELFNDNSFAGTKNWLSTN